MHEALGSVPSTERGNIYKSKASRMGLLKFKRYINRTLKFFSIKASRKARLLRIF